MTSKSRYNLALFLSLLVWPGAGSFLMGRRCQGLFISLLAGLSLILLIYGLVGFILAIAPAFAMGLALEEVITQISLSYDTSFVWVLILSLILFIISWVYSLVDLIVAKKTIKQGEDHV